MNTRGRRRKKKHDDTKERNENMIFMFCFLVKKCAVVQYMTFVQFVVQ